MIRTEKQFKKYMSEMAKDIVADGFDLDQCAGDIADSLFHNSDLRKYVLKKNPWIETKRQWREFMADMIVE